MLLIFVLILHSKWSNDSHFEHLLDCNNVTISSASDSLVINGAIYKCIYLLTYLLNA